jgi:HAD superfamily hydrolase (TIGR01549 family)
MTSPSADTPASETTEAAPSTVVFDVGEVLIDETRVWSVWAEIVGVSPLTFAAVLGAAIVQGEGADAVFGHLAPNLEWREFEPEHERRYGGFREEDLYPDVRPCLEDLTTSGFDVVIAGNQPARRQAQLEQLHLPHRAMAMSEQLGVEKPDPAFFDHVRDLARVSEASQLLYVGDRTDNDVVIAAARGWRTCWLRRGPWGQLQDLPDDAEEPDLVLEGLGELATLLETWRGGTT